MRQMEQLNDLGRYRKQLAEAGYKPSIFMVGQYRGGAWIIIPVIGMAIKCGR